MLKKILLPTDGTVSGKVLNYFISHPNINDADIYVLNVIESNLLKSLPQRGVRKSLMEHLCEERKEVIKKFIKKLEEEGIIGEGLNFEVIVKKGTPSDVILKTADELGVDHIIMAKSDKNPIEKAIMGSTTEKVVHGAKIPVIVIS